MVPGSAADKAGLKTEDRIRRRRRRGRCTSLAAFFTRLQAAPGDNPHRDGHPRGRSRWHLGVPMVRPKSQPRKPFKVSNSRRQLATPLPERRFEQISQILGNSIRTLKALLLPQGDVGLSNMSGFVGVTQGFGTR